LAGAEQFTEVEWVKFLGAVPLEVGTGGVIMGLDPRPVHLNHNETVNAAVLFGLVEVAGAGALVAGMLEEAASSYIVVKRASIEYDAPARGELKATGSLAPEIFGDALAAVRGGEPVEVPIPVEVRDSKGQLVCHAEVTVIVRPRRPSRLGEPEISEPELETGGGS
jgi:acyl-coenzyme A thioesterase PaaI-like protein